MATKCDYSARPPVSVERYPFARGTLLRRLEGAALHAQDGCSWCGGIRRGGKLYCFGWEDDQNRPIAWDSKAFCSRSCRDTYNA